MPIPSAWLHTSWSIGAFGPWFSPSRKPFSIDPIWESFLPQALRVVDSLVSGSSPRCWPRWFVWEGFFWYSLQMAGFVMKGRRKPVQIFWMQHNLYLWGSRFASLLGVSGCPVSDFEGWDTKGSPFRFDTADSCFVFRWLHVVSQILGFEILGALPLVSNWFWTLRCYIRLRSLNKNLSQNRLGTDQAASQNDRVWCLQVCFGPTERWVVWWRQVSHSYCT